MCANSHKKTSVDKIPGYIFLILGEIYGAAIIFSGTNCTVASSHSGSNPEMATIAKSIFFRASYVQFYCNNNYCSLIKYTVLVIAFFLAFISPIHKILDKSTVH